MLYQIALSIRPEATLEETARSALSTYLQGLDCSAGAVFESQAGPDGGLGYELVAAVPEQSPLADAVHAARAAFPETLAALDRTLPVVDEDGDLVVADCNREFAATLGYSRGEVRDRPLAGFYTEESRRAHEEGGYDRALDGEFGTTERTLETREGAEISTLTRATPRQDRRGRVVGTNALFVDVTELKRRNQQLTVLNRILRHNVRNDLTAIDGYLEIARRLVEGEADERLSDIASRTESLLSTTEVADRVRRSLGQTDVSRQDQETKLDHGSGLGLWLVYWVLERSGGALAFDCESGTEVSVSLSVAESGDGSDDSL